MSKIRMDLPKFLIWFLILLIVLLQDSEKSDDTDETTDRLRSIQKVFSA